MYLKRAVFKAILHVFSSSVLIRNVKKCNTKFFVKLFCLSSRHSSLQKLEISNKWLNMDVFPEYVMFHSFKWPNFTVYNAENHQSCRYLTENSNCVIYLDISTKMCEIDPTFCHHRVRRQKIHNPDIFQIYFRISGVAGRDQNVNLGHQGLGRGQKPAFGLLITAPILEMI